MENYTRGNSKEAPLEREDIPIDCLPEKFLWMKVKPGSKMRNVLGYASSAFKDERVVLWSGSGPAIIKAISCAEIMKRKYKNLHQITRICFHKHEETWEPIKDGLDKLLATREVPTIHIMLSKESLDKSQLGYQGPGDVNSSFKLKAPQDVKKKIAYRKGKPVKKEPKEKIPVKSREPETFANESTPTEPKRNQKRKRQSESEQKKE
ncbi:ribonuclease P protein subunit p25-like protein isoform X2 [Hetaerina americana]|uniref:ribonuclease P protein subunit p25-like protein isoform X2 n=1 Tax=Hetaerina americana TaxID=62018 RepID=UPI003A7F4C75